MHNVEIDRTHARIHRINDNAGKDFHFQKLLNRDIWIVQDAFNQAVSKLPPAAGRALTQPQYDVLSDDRALASIANTDVLVAGIKHAPVGLTLNPVTAEARAAWYSFGFMLRRAASVILDVAEAELDVGIQPQIDLRTPFAPPTARVFISDTLENGAGYSRHLGTPAEFEKLLRFMLGQGGKPSREFFEPYVQPPHERDCSSSCRCLREYGNMAYHPLLDWRLAFDMVRLALDAQAPIDLNQTYWRSLVQRTSTSYFQGLGYVPMWLSGLPAGHDAGRNEVVILTHPLWDQQPANFGPDLARAVADAESKGWQWKLKTIFRAVRFPYE